MHARSTTALILLTLTAALAAAPQADRTRLLDLARTGKAADAWRAWDVLPAGADKQRLGVEIASEAKQISRGLELYDELTNNGATRDAALLKRLALGTAADLSADADIDTRALACGGALVLDQTHAPCRKALETTANAGKDTTEQAIALYTLANAGLRPFPGLMSTAETNLSKPMRMRFAQTMTRLPAAERLSLVRPLLDDPDIAVQYQTVLVLADVPGNDVAAALRNVRPMGPLRMGAAIALARHGDKPSLATVADALPGLNGYEKIQAARALVEALDPRGIGVLDEMLRSGVDVDRVNAALALGRINPDAAHRTLVESLNGGSAAIQPLALHAAGVVGMAGDRLVYKKLADAGAPIRAAAVAAMAQSLAAPPAAPGRLPSQHP